MAISIPPKGDADKKIGAQFAPLSVTAQDTPNMTVKIRAGWFYNTNGDVLEYPGGNSPTIVAPGSNAKWVIVAINNSDSVVLVNGAAAVAPTLPSLPVAHMPLAFVYVATTTSAIHNDKVFDARPLFRGVDLVPNLAAELADRPTFTDVAANLDDKADVDGTPNSDFELNKGVVVPTDAQLTVERGASPTVAIRWNETTQTWQFTNDGTLFLDIEAVSGVTQFLKNTVTTDFGGFSPAFNGETAVDTVSVTGAVVGDLVTLGLPATPDAGFLFDAWVSASDVVTIRTTGVQTTVVPAWGTTTSQTYSVLVTQYANV